MSSGWSRKPWVEDIVGPGLESRHRVSDQRGPASRTSKYLGFHIVGYGCTTCIGNSGPLPEPISSAVNERGLVAVSVLSGNRNFEGRISPDARANYLASPPLVVAYALAGTVDWDPINEPLGQDRMARRVPARHLAHSGGGGRLVASSCQPGPVPYRDTPRSSPDPTSGERSPPPKSDLYHWDADTTYIQEPPFFVDLGPGCRPDRSRSPVPGCWPSWVTRSPPTTSARPGPSRRRQPAGQYLIAEGVQPGDVQLATGRGGATTG